MSKHYLYLAAIASLGILAGVWARGYSDGKGWTANAG